MSIIRELEFVRLLNALSTSILFSLGSECLPRTACP